MIFSHIDDDHIRGMISYLQKCEEKIINKVWLNGHGTSVYTILIDDPIGHFDDINVLSFIDVLRTIINKTNWQIIISTHEENFYEIMKVKLSSEYYNSKFFVFESEGRIIQDK